MKKVFLISFVLLTIASLSFAATFAPTIMTLTTPAEIEYQFDGNELSIPLTVTGTPSALWLVINTKGKADTVVDVQNGYLGWHYMNKIDTTVYISDRYQREPGETTIVWDGNDQDGNAVAAGTYDYFLWGYDDKTSRQLACDYIQIGFDWNCQFTHIYEVGEDGLPLTNPLIVGNAAMWMSNDAVPSNQFGSHFKWVIGSDPLDISFKQTTDCPIYGDWDAGNTSTSGFFYGGPVFNPDDYNIFYNACANYEAQTATMFKFQWVTDGDAIFDEDWLGWDELTWEDRGIAIGSWSQKPGAYTDRNYIYVVSPGLHQKEEEWNKLRCVSFDGEVIFDKMLHEWYYPDDPNPHGYINGAFHHLYSRGNNHWMVVSHTSCMHEMIDTTRILVDPDDDDDMILFQNANGDYWMDSAYEPTVEPAWYCLADDKTTSMRRDSVTIDSNGFNVIYTTYLGLVTFGVSTQDGTAVDYMSIADDTISDDSGFKMGGLLCDNGSNYDGLYMAHALTTETVHVTGNTWYVAFDSCHGIITNEPVIEPGVEEGQASYSVDQNSPNPFNPTTSINFTIPETNHVTVDIYNVAGQKVDTLVNDFIDAGKHSLIWDASGFSNGIYFYTVKSGDFSKTMKMTLLK